MSTNTLKTAYTRAWNDLEPKVVAWLTAGGLLTVVTIVLHYFGVLDIPFWVAPAVTYLAGFLASYIKKSVVKVPAPAPEHSATETATPPARL